MLDSRDWSGASALRPIRTIEHEWIPLADGCRLAARIWLPEDAEAVPVPALLEYIPYRKNDWTAAADAIRHSYFAERGYASLRVDIRGSGDSDGLLTGKYLRQEQDDALEVLDWMAGQPWSSGVCGMFGLSWGGYSALQAAARKPPSLKAVISVCASDDRYADDVSYVGGAVLAFHIISWASMMLAYNARPPDPSVSGEAWRVTWQRRLEGSTPFIETALSHQKRDQHWKHGSVCEDYSAIECPVFLVGGWADCFRDGLFRLLERLPGEKRALVGPWGHQFPDDGVPGPRVDFLEEAVRWFDYWLKNIDTGVMREPLLRAWMPESVEPRCTYSTRAGRWVTERSWPTPDISLERRSLSFSGDLASSKRVVGLGAGAWCGFAVPGDFAADQRLDDSLSLCATSSPLRERLEILGFPEVVLTLVSDRPQATVAVRLCDVRPDGSSLLVTRGVLNLCHRTSHEAPQPLEPGVPYTVAVRLNAIAHSFPAQHRLRVAVSPTYWPWVWPSPELVELRVVDGELFLPQRSSSTMEVAWVPPPAPQRAQRLSYRDEGIPSSRRLITHDHANERHLVQWDHDPNRGVVRTFADGLAFSTHGSDSYSLQDRDPLSATARSRWQIALGRADWQVRIDATGALTSSRDCFRTRNRLRAYLGGDLVYDRAWPFSVRREYA
jgi:predicted acyl esterase